MGPYTYDVETPLIDYTDDDGVVLIPFDVTDDVAVCGFKVSFYLTHTYDDDLVLRLIRPDGVPIVLSYGNGGSDDDFGTGTDEADRTTIDSTHPDDSSLDELAGSEPPFVGNFAPDGVFLTYFEEDVELAEFLATAGSALGTWQLEIRDTAGEDTGTFYIASLYILRCPPPILAGVRTGRTKVVGSRSETG